MLKGSAGAALAPAAFELAADRIEKQLRRYKRRLKDRHAQSAHAEADRGEAGYTVFAPPPEEEEPVDNPPIVAETRVDIPTASVSDAVMLLDLRNTNALLFRNSSHRRLQHGLPTRRRHDRLGRAAARLSRIPAFLIPRGRAPRPPDRCTR